MGQIGTIKLQTQNSGTVDVPVFDTGDSGSSVYEFLRVQTASGVGFIPLVDTADASFPYLRVQSQNQGIVAVHNEASLGIDELIDNFEDGDVTTKASNWDGWTGTTVDLTASQNVSIEGNYVGEFGPHGTFESIYTKRDSPFQPTFFGVSVKANTLTGSDTDAFNFRLRDSSGTLVIFLTFRHNGNVEASEDVVASWETGQTYRIRADNIDFSTETYDVYLNGNLVATGKQFRNTGSELQELRVKNDPDPDDPFYFDNVRIGQE